MVWGKFREQGQRLISKASQNKLLKVGPWTNRSASLGILVDMQICSFHLRPTESSSLKGSVLTKLLFVSVLRTFAISLETSSPRGTGPWLYSLTQMLQSLLKVLTSGSQSYSSAHSSQPLSVDVTSPELVILWGRICCQTENQANLCSIHLAHGKTTSLPLQTLAM